MRISDYSEAASIMAATTIGAGIFALPWVMSRAGAPAFLFLLLGLGGIVVFAEVLYWRVLEKTGERLRLVKLAERYLKRRWELAAFISVLGGMLLTQVIYLILGARFIGFISPFPPLFNLFIFWLLAGIPALLSVRRLAFMELAGTIAMAFIIIAIFLLAPWTLASLPRATSVGAIFTAFGIILFSLSGWIAVEPMQSVVRRRTNPIRLIGGSMLLIISLYALFSVGILSWSGGLASEDAISGAALPAIATIILAIFGIIAIWTSYIPSVLEIESVLRKDFHFREASALIIVLFTPLFLVLAGFDNFIVTAGFAGAVFTGLQYIIIFLVAQRVLRLRNGKAFAVYASVIIFSAAAIIEVYRFFAR